MQTSYPPIPVDAALFLTKRYSYEKPTIIHKWDWSTTFGCWSALVTFADGEYTWTYPKKF